MGPADRVLMLAWDFQSAYVHEIANAFARTGSKVVLIGGDGNATPPYEPGVEFRNLRGSTAPNRRALAKARGLVQAFRRTLRCARESDIPFVYHIGVGKTFIIDICLNLLLKLHRKRIIHTVHNILPHGRRTRLNRLLYRLIYHRIADHLVVHAENIVEQLVREFGVPPRKITHVRHGVYRPAEDSGLTRESARRLLGLPADAFVALAFGRQHPYKGTHLLLQAAASAGRLSSAPGAARGGRLKILVRGLAGRPYAERLLRLVEENRLSDIVDCAFGFASDREMERLFKACDVAVLPYLEGSQSGVFYMAYAFGRPVLASDIGCFQNHILPGKTGEVFRSGDAGALWETLMRMRAGIEQYREPFIREYARRNYSWEASAEKIRREILLQGVAHAADSAPEL